MRHLIPISGKDSLATALLQTTHYPDLGYEFFFNDTGAELPETYDWLDKVEKKTNWDIKKIGCSLEGYINKYGGFLPSPKARFCTKETKIKPTESYLKNKGPVTIYYGLRADENRTGYVPWGDSQITPSYPLQTFGIDLPGVWAILTAQDLLPPSFRWDRLVNAVSRRIDISGLTPVEEYFLFAGRSRANCYFCFYQRQYEIVWLLEKHPDYAEKMASFERGKNYTWRSDFSVDELAQDEARQSRIFDRRVDEVVKYIAEKRQLKLPFLTVDNEIAGTSCGLTCAK